MGSIARKARRLQEQEDAREERLQILRERTGNAPALPRAWVGSMKRDPVADHFISNPVSEADFSRIAAAVADDPDAP